MRRSTASLLLLLAFVTFAVSCGDEKSRPVLPTAPQLAPPTAANFSFQPGTCFTAANLVTLLKTVFGAGHGGVGPALIKLNTMIIRVLQNRIPEAQAAAKDLIIFLQQQMAAAPLAGTKAQIQSLITAILCFVGLPLDTFIVTPSATETQTVVTGDGHTGITLPPGSVPAPMTITITGIDPNTPPLITKLDKYPGYILVQASSVLNSPAVIEVCPTPGLEALLRARLRLGHQKPGGFEITPPAPPGYVPLLNCDGGGTASLESHTPGWLKSLASLILPKPLYAKMRAGGGVGGVASEFSPFGPVDPELRAVGGVGGVGSEFQTRPGTPGTLGPLSANASKQPVVSNSLIPGARASTVVGGVCTAVDGNVGGAVEPECRPVMTLKTANGTIMQNVPVDWLIGLGGGTVAPEVISPPSCGSPFASTAATTTNVNGMAGVCWNLGASSSGDNTVKGTPRAGGDAPDGVIFSPPHVVFTATANKLTPTASAAGVSVPYDGLPHPGSGTCSMGPAAVLSYDLGGAVPVDVGAHQLTVTCGGGDVYNTVVAGAVITITALTPTIAINCPASVVYTGAALTPCSATVTAVNLNLAPTPTYTNNVNVGTATATVNFAATGNYGAATLSKDFGITPATSATAVVCPASQTFTGSPLTPCTASVTGAGGLALTPTPTYAANVNVGTATASYTYAGDANHSGSNDSKNFQITPAATLTTLSCAPSTYTGSPLNPCSASVSGPGLSAPVGVSYSPSPVVGAGSYNASAAYLGGGNYLGSSAGPQPFSVSKRAATATAGSGSKLFAASNPTLPCSVSGLLAADAGAVTCTTSIPATPTAGTYATTPVISPANPPNYAVAPVNGTFTVIAYVQQGCFASPINNSVTPPVMTGTSKGNSVTVTCRLVEPSGRPIVTAHGNLLVQDMGTNGLGTPVVPAAFAGTNVFTTYNDGDFDNDDGIYKYNLSTSPSAFIRGHYYLVTATWNDGTTTKGWIYIRP